MMMMMMMIKLVTQRLVFGIFNVGEKHFCIVQGTALLFVGAILYEYKVKRIMRQQG